MSLSAIQLNASSAKHDEQYGTRPGLADFLSCQTGNRHVGMIVYPLLLLSNRFIFR